MPVFVTAKASEAVRQYAAGEEFAELARDEGWQPFSAASPERLG